MQAIRNFMARLSGRSQDSGYKFDYDPNTQTYNQTAGPGMKKGGKVSASKRGDGIAQRGKTKGRMI